ncbi:hypothetical protein BS17DRAFT_797578 [Gyrodon lividus]|nr:hypothetical protein BS17DRAFT_797578 [Gyrodon lividus]
MKSGFQLGGGQTQHVIGSAEKTQYQQWDGNCENITIMVTICADGDEIPPTVIYKGWTDKVLARLLLIDGHNSHYMKDFLNYARLNDIHVLCYPAHATHIYQGLDVVVFGPLKNAWTKECDEFESSTRQKVMKANFISIYTKAHQKAITPEIICTAFRVTGVWPFNPEVVTVDMMAPSVKSRFNPGIPR